MRLGGSVPRTRDSPNIQENTKAIISLVISKLSDYSPSRVRNYLLKHHSEYGLTKDQIPKIRSIQRIAREKSPEIKKLKDNPLDQPWTLGACSAFSQYFPADSLPVLMEHKIFCDEQNSPEEEERTVKIINSKVWEPLIAKMKESGRGDVPPFLSVFAFEKREFTIRQAIWMARLVRVVSRKLKNKLGPNTLEFIAHYYSRAEQINEMLQRKVLDTSDLDKLFFAESSVVGIVPKINELLNKKQDGKE
jgi:hypothetical protein